MGHDSDFDHVPFREIRVEDIRVFKHCRCSKKRGSRKRTKVNVPNQLILISCKEREREEREKRERRKRKIGCGEGELKRGK